ncbi:fumarylacetoacetate hydrolase [Brevibacterium sp. 5221]|uniref:Fumarylacetoacetate hydrolase n=1 Tax=Brevibacterium rongguiense TaxID=2695267 RepID=A0A6N9H955_9MICO|nr:MULTISPECIES: fumarylacetoacetate hydrolase family protein [Brevibacterium]MYM20578.1 fumarylacetoacetate hydrolase [Brevibacterium rongguiense]WAL39680.1 fumarylacetoacetate hydrolase family protein [Brevibacterium sp. BRM-1]
MQIGNRSGRLVLIEGDRALDVERASDGAFGPDPQDAYERWEAFRQWAEGQDASAGEPFDVAELGAPVPRPRQIMAIGLNYADHAAESGFDLPENPVVFAKFASSLTGARADVAVTGDQVDWEVELVAVIGTGGRNIPEAQAWDHVAGLTVGQDISDREVQFWGNPPQFSLGKSQEGFAPVGPAVVTLDEVDAAADRSDLALSCTVTHPDGTSEELQSGRTSSLIFTVPDLIARLSKIVELYPGDLIFTGTPDGVGIGRDPQVFLQAGDVLRTQIEGLGEIEQTFVGR